MPARPACLDEMFDPHNRRFGYALTNCTDCGPRYTVTHALPYDRRSTSMADLRCVPPASANTMIPTAAAFMPNPTPAPTAGRNCAFAMPTASRWRRDSVALAVATLRRGEILAIKDLGGFHLVCDAAEAVARLRARKHRPSKPFAVMVPNLASAARWAQLSPLEADALTSSARPVVIAQRHSTAGLEGVGGAGVRGRCRTRPDHPGRSAVH